MNSIAIIIPVLNEAKNISKLLWHLNTQATTNSIKDIIIVDGGSTDDTAKISTSEGAKVISSPKGRATQMNRGAHHTTATILYFLHADSFPPNGFDRMIVHEVQKGNLAGCFKMKFDSSHWWLQLAGWFTKFNWKACRGGDQSLFVTKEFFNELGGFDEGYTIYEDINFINKLYTQKQFTVIQKPIITSARRYRKNGVWKLQFHFWMIYLKKWLGATAKDLEIYYQKHVS